MTTTERSIAGLDGERVTLMPERLDELQARVDGPLLRAGHEGWDDSVLVWNGMVAMVPALVLQPPSAHDVAAAVAKAYDPGNLFRANRRIRPRA